MRGSLVPSWHRVRPDRGVRSPARRPARFGPPMADRRTEELTRSLRMREDVTRSSVRFEPLHPASRASLITGVVVGPLLWLIVLALAAWVFEYGWAIALGVLVVVVTFVAALIVLSLLRAWRVRQERRYVDSR